MFIKRELKKLNGGINYYIITQDFCLIPGATVTSHLLEWFPELVSRTNFLYFWCIMLCVNHFLLWRIMMWCWRNIKHVVESWVYYVAMENQLARFNCLSAVKMEQIFITSTFSHLHTLASVLHATLFKITPLNKNKN